MDFSFCPKCGHHLVIRLIDGRERQVCSRCSFVFYQNSKPCSSVLLVDSGKLLLVKRNIEPYHGWWDIPGGFLEAGEHPEVGAVREMVEETGLHVNPVRLLGIYMDQYGADGDHTLNFCYLAELVGGDPAPASDALELRWFELDDLPEAVAFTWSADALQQLQGLDW